MSSLDDGGEVTVPEKSSRTDKAGHQRNFNNRGGPGECGRIMGCVGSDCEDGLRFKLPKKILDECSTVSHVSVPRKLRSSAMKKRSIESISSPSQASNKLNRVAHGDQLLEIDGPTKSKLKMKQVGSEGCVRSCIQEAVTKDEEEVVEALYALSGLFANHATTKNTNLSGGESGSGAKSSTVAKAESFVPAVDAKEQDEPEMVNPSNGAVPILSSSAAGSSGETAKTHCSKDTKQSDDSLVKQPAAKFDGEIPEVNLHLTCFTSENQQAAMSDSVSDAWTQLRKTRSKVTPLEKRPANHKYPEIVLPPIADGCDNNTEIQHTTTKARDRGSSSRLDLSKTGSSLRPNFYSAISSDNQRLGTPLQSQITQLPSRIENNSCSAKSPSLETNAIAKKGALFFTHSKNSWKRSTAHVYISCFIKSFQDRDVNNRASAMQSSSRVNEAPNQRVHRTDIDIGVVSSDTIGVSSPGKQHASEVNNAILLHKRLVLDHQQASNKQYDVFTTQNQSLGFLSMPAGGARIENSTGINRAGNSLEASTSARTPCLQSQNQVYIPFAVPQNAYLSTSSSGHHHPVAPGLQVQMPPYFGGRAYAPPFKDANALSAQPLEQQQHCYRQPLLMANFESGVVPPSIPDKPTGGGPDIPPFLQPAQISFPPSFSSLEVLGSRYTSILQQQQQQQQQQQLISATSPLPSSATKGPYHRVPSSAYEANADRVRPDKASLQIICNQYI